MSFSHELLVRPVSALTIVGCSVWWLYSWNSHFAIERIAFSYQKVVLEKQWWRIATASYSHANFFHIVFNMTSLWSLSPLEESLGVIAYASITYLLVIFSMLLVCLYKYCVVRYFNREQEATQPSVGYSCVIFGLMAYASIISPSRSMSFLGLFSIPAVLSPFGSLLLTQLIVPRASFIGHLSGIIIGYLIGLGAFSWFHTYLFLCVLTWSLWFLLTSIKQTSEFDIPCLEIIDNSESDLEGGGTGNYKLVNGILVHRTDSDFEDDSTP